MEQSDWFANVVTLGSVIGALVTAIATFMLWRVTAVLAKEIKRMVEASSRPHVVATIDANQWSLRHADLNITNTGNATAYDIQVSFEPPLKGDLVVPPKRISVMRPGQGFSSYLSEFKPLLDQTYKITISWLREPTETVSEVNIYSFDFQHLQKTSRLGSSDPIIQIAEEIKKIRENWAEVAKGNRKIQADIFTSGDRLHQRRLYERLRRQAQREENAGQ